MEKLDYAQIGTSPIEDFKHTEEQVEYNFDVCVFIGRFQPFHNGHFRVVMNALEESDKILILIGSSKTSSTPKNFFDFKTRRELIYKGIDKKYHHRLDIHAIRDNTYNDATWLATVQSQVNTFTKDNDRIAITGCFKDDGSWYLKSFPQWVLLEQDKYYGLDATHVRQLMFDGKITTCRGLVPERVANYLEDFIKTSVFEDIKQEHEFVVNYKKSWEVAPYPPIFVTTDAVVTQAGHVLVIERGMNPGKGKLALPGGFVGNKELIENSAIRELYEETHIQMPKNKIRECKVAEKVFDHPERSSRGRTVTHAFHYDLGTTTTQAGLPIVKADDDAAKALWMPTHEIATQEERFYEDHYHIIDYFIRRI